MDEFDCFQCGRGGADEHIGLCALCFASLDPYTRKRAEHFAIQAALVRQALIEEEGMGARWSEQQYREYLRRAQAPAPREDRKASGGGKPPKHDPNALVFELPLTPTRNALDRMHFRAKRRLMETLAQHIMTQVPLASGIPFRRATVEVVRQSSVEPDPDGLYGFVKPVLDAMQVRSARHPYGAGVIANDNHDSIELKVRWEKVAPRKGKTIVIVTPR